MLPDVYASLNPSMRASQRPTVLILSNGIGLTAADRNLTNDLADGFVAGGSEVIVAAIDWSGRGRGADGLVVLPNGVEVFYVPPWSFNRAGAFIRNASKWLFSSVVASRRIGRAYRDRPVHMVVASSPLITCGYLILWARRLPGAKLLAYLTDFFPFHQRAAGQIPGGPVLRAGAVIETFLMRRFDAVACMSPAGLEYLRSHYRLRPEQRTGIVRLWGETSAPPPIAERELRARFSLPAGPIAIFGGQISEGRGIEDILAAAVLAKQRGLAVTFLFVGAGRLEPLVRRHIEHGGDNVLLLPPVGRDAYLHLLSACTVALVATVANTGVPTFPSKTIDYLRAGLPVVAAVEDSTDYSAFVEENGFGIATSAGDIPAYVDAIATLMNDELRRAQMAAAGRTALARHFDPDVAAATMMELALGGRHPGKRVDAAGAAP